MGGFIESKNDLYNHVPITGINQTTQWVQAKKQKLDHSMKLLQKIQQIQETKKEDQGQDEIRITVCSDVGDENETLLFSKESSNWKAHPNIHAPSTAHGALHPYRDGDVESSIHAIPPNTTASTSTVAVDLKQQQQQQQQPDQHISLPTMPCNPHNLTTSSIASVPLSLPPPVDNNGVRRAIPRNHTPKHSQNDWIAPTVVGIGAFLTMAAIGTSVLIPLAAAKGLSGGAMLLSGLANLGGGSIASGGFGMLGGKIVLASLSTSAAAASAAATARLQKD